MSTNITRRDLLRNSAFAAPILAAPAIVLPGAAVAQDRHAAVRGDVRDQKGKEPEVSAAEDLMREHGVIRRALLVYFEAVPKLRQNPAALDAAVLHRAAQLFRKFGEDYHERMLEEQHIFPVVRKMSSPLARYADILTAQHQRGREITDYILGVTASGKISAAHAEPLARVFEGLTLMYQNHAAREDTIVFPAWKKNYSNLQMDEISDQFEEIEHRMFGKDGFEDAEKTISTIEQQLGFEDLAQFTPPSPPKP